MNIAPHNSLEYVTPDTMAECYDGVSADLYAALWRSLEGMKPISDQIDMEESSPSDALGLNSIASVWNCFTDDEKTQINEIAAKRAAEYAAWNSGD